MKNFIEKTNSLSLILWQNEHISTPLDHPRNVCTVWKTALDVGLALDINTNTRECMFVYGHERLPPEVFQLRGLTNISVITLGLFFVNPLDFSSAKSQ